VSKHSFSSPDRLQVAALAVNEMLSDVYMPGARKPPICQLPQPPSPVISSPTALGKIEQVVPSEKRLYLYLVIAWLLVGLFMLLAVIISDSLIRAQDWHILHHSTKRSYLYFTAVSLHESETENCAR
jgi:hypothetical protein